MAGSPALKLEPSPETVILAALGPGAAACARFMYPQAAESEELSVPDQERLHPWEHMDQCCMLSTKVTLRRDVEQGRSGTLKTIIVEDTRVRLQSVRRCSAAGPVGSSAVIPSEQHGGSTEG